MSVQDAYGDNIKPNTYITNHFISKYIGTWEWTHNNKKLVVTFKVKTINMVANQNVTMDMLAGEYKFYEDGKLTQLDTSAYQYAFLGTTKSSYEPVVFAFGKAKQIGSVNLALNFIDDRHLSLNLYKKREWALTPGTDFLFPYNIELRRVVL